MAATREAAMRRRTKLLLAALLVVGVAVWLSLARPWTTLTFEKRLAGNWEGRGTLSGEMTLDVAPNQDSPGGKAAGHVRTACTVRAEFKSDGTYTWKEDHRSEHGDTSFNMSFWVPKEGGEPFRWDVVRDDGNKLTIRMHRGEVVLEFQDPDSFTLAWPESAQTKGALLFRRSAR
jgi:hypothetical protein